MNTYPVTRLSRLYSLMLVVLAVVLGSCSSVRYPQTDGYYGYFNPREPVVESEAPSVSQSDLATEENYAPATESTVTSSTSSNQLASQYSTSYPDGTPVVVNNYYSSGYTPVITPWWNSYYSSWSYGQPGFSVGYGYSPWTTWRFNYDPWYGSTYSWGYNWYAPWYGCNPYYGVGYRPYYTYYDSYYGRPWYSSSASWGGYYDHYTVHRDERRWGSARAVSGAPGTSTSVGGYVNPGGRERAVPLGTSRTSESPQIESTRFGRARNNVVPQHGEGSTSTQATTNSPFSDPRVTQTEDTGFKPRNRSNVNTPSNQSPSVPDRVRSGDGSGTVRVDGERSSFGGSRSSTRMTVPVPSASVTGASRTVTPASAPATSGSPKASTPSSGSSSGGGRRR